MFGLSGINRDTLYTVSTAGSLYGQACEAASLWTEKSKTWKDVAFKISFTGLAVLDLASHFDLIRNERAANLVAYNLNYLRLAVAVGSLFCSAVAKVEGFILFQRLATKELIHNTEPNIPRWGGQIPSDVGFKLIDGLRLTQLGTRVFMWFKWNSLNQ